MNSKFASKNDIVEIILPSTSCTFGKNNKIKNFIRKIGLVPNIFLEEEFILRKSPSHGFPSFAAEKRFQQLKKAVENPHSKIIWCARGGYGSADILPFLEKLEKPKTPKIFIGFSDISALNNLLIEKWNWSVVSAPMLAQIVSKRVSEKSIKAIIDFIFGRTTELKYNLKTIIAAEKPIKAIVTGGCLSVLAGQFGTKNQINFADKILFLEDIGEDGERLDRYFSQLVQIMNEQKKYPKAILLGNFLEANQSGTPKEKNIKTAIKKFAEKLSIPLFEEKSKCLGHSKNMLPLVLGMESEISVKGNLIQKF